jgi:hypothetical protein
MTKLEKIEQAIASLSREEQAKLEEWWARFRSEAWDRQIEEDAKAGRLDKLAEEALADHRAGSSPLSPAGRG